MDAQCTPEKDLTPLGEMLGDVVDILVRPEDNTDIGYVRQLCRQKCDQLEAMGYLIWQWPNIESEKEPNWWRMFTAKDAHGNPRYHAIITAQKKLSSHAQLTASARAVKLTETPSRNG